MLAMICGVVLALSFLGLPMAIIGLFIMSIVDQRSPRGRRRGKALITTTNHEIVVRYPERGVEGATPKRRDEIRIWRNLGVERDISVHVSGK